MTVFAETMHRLHRTNIWDGVTPGAGAVQGWNGDHPALARLAVAPGARIIIDVGVWKGQSTIAMATALRDAGIDGCVIAVDTFLGSPEHWGGEGLFATRHGMPDLYETFLGNVAAAGLQGFVVPMAQTASGAAAILRDLGITASLVHIDGDHAYAAVAQDARDYWPIVAPGGHLVGDDYHPSWPGVMRAAQEFAAFLGRPLAVEPPKWIIRKGAPPGGR